MDFESTITRLQNLHDDLSKIIDIMNRRIEKSEDISFQVMLIEDIRDDMREVLMNRSERS